MNIKKVEKSVRKISQLVDNIKDEGDISRIERDLLLSYVRDLYDKIIDVEAHQENKEKKSSTQEQPSPRPTRSHEVSAADLSEVVRKELNVPPTPEPIQPPTSLPLYSDTDTYTRTNVQVETQISTPEAPKPVQEAIVEPTAPAELLALFDQDAISELSDKLSRAPIADLTKCMGINERIFTVNELFGGDSGLFNTTMQELDKVRSIEEARDYLLAHVATHHNWASDGKLKKASNFVKLISRRY